MTGEIFDIKRFAVHDGPGIRCTAFFKGCSLRCLWCHNPEGMRSGPEIGCQFHTCVGCGACVGACPQGAVLLVGRSVSINREHCVRCGKCAAVCPSGALYTKGCEMTEKALLEELVKDEVFFQTSGGGITLSGGDPLFQPKFARAVLTSAKAWGLHTAVETALYAAQEAVDLLADAVNLWLCDIKALDDSLHRRLTGVSNRPILRNYEQLTRHKAALLTRIPVIPGCTDSRENLTAIGRYIAEINPGGAVELMFYNPLGESKYKSFGMDYALADSGPYTTAEKAKFKEMVVATGVANVL